VRATWTPLVGQGFEVSSAKLRLVAVDDVAGALGDAALRGSQDAFALTFTGVPGAVAPVTQTVAHPALGSHALLVTPVGAVTGGVQRYEILVDRSVGKPADPPAPAPGRSAPPEHPGSPEAAAAAVSAARADIAKGVRARTRRVARARLRKGRKQRTTGTALIKRRTTRRRKRPSTRRTAAHRAAARRRAR
jgi:hypothetical protein